MRRLSLVGAVLALVAVPAVAQTPTVTTPVRVAGEVEKLDGNDLMINTKDGQPSP
jgi:hypothetical protein